MRRGSSVKDTFLSFLNNPPLAIGVAIVIAGIIGIIYVTGARHPSVQFVAASPGNIEGVSASGIQNEGGHLSLGFLSAGRIQSVSAVPGQTVGAGTVLASLDPGSAAGTLTQATAAYHSASASYEKTLAGASGPTIDIARTAVDTAKTALKQTTDEQNTLVMNAERKLYSDNLVAVSADESRLSIAPMVSGTYIGNNPGTYQLSFRDANDFTENRIAYAGLEKGVADKNNTSQPLGSHGLYLTFPDLIYRPDDRWTVDIPNKSGDNYTANFNAYQAALQSRDQAIAAAQSKLTQDEADYSATVAAARPEDVAAASAAVESAKGALQIAQAAFDNTRIVAPADGVVSAVHITPGQIAVPSAPAIELSGVTTQKNVSVMVPNSAVGEENGKQYVEVKTPSGTQKREVTVGVHDTEHTEITSGLSSGDLIAVPYTL